MANNFVNAPKPVAPTFKDPLASIKNPVEAFTKPTPKAPSKKTGASVDSKTIYNPVVTQERTWVKTWVGFWQWQTVDTIEKGYSIPSFNTEYKDILNSQAYLSDAKNLEAWLTDDTFDTKKAKQLDKSLFTNTSSLNLKSTLSDISLAKAKAQKDIEAFHDPSSTIAKAFRTNIGETKYKEYTEFLWGVNNYVTALRSDKELAKSLPSFTRSLYNSDLLRGVTNLATWGEMEKFNAAADFLSDKWEIETSVGSKIKKIWGTLVGDLPKYMVLWAAADYAATEGLINAGYTVGWNIWYNMTKVGNGVRRIAQTSPYLYNATVNNSVMSVLDYGTQKAIGKDYSTSDFVSSLFMGAVVPSVFKGVGDAIWSFKNMVRSTPKDIKALESAVNKEIEIGWAKNAKEAIDNLSDGFKFEDGETLGNKLDTYISKVWKNTDNSISHQELRASLAEEGVTIGSAASKKVADTLSELNSKLKFSEEPWVGWGDIGADGKIQIAKFNIVSRIREAKKVNIATVRKIIDEETKGLDAGGGNKEMGVTDTVDDLFHSDWFTPSHLPNATTIQEVSKALDGKDKLSLKDIDNSRLDIETMNKWGAKSVEKLAKQENVGFDWDKAVTDWKTNKAYLHEVLDRVEASTTWYTKFASKVKKNILWKIESVRVNLKSASKFDAIWLGKEAIDNTNTISSEIRTLVKRLKSATSQVEKKAIKETIDKKNLQISKLKTSHNEYKSNVKVIRWLVRSELDSWSERYPMVSAAIRSTVKNKYKAMVSSTTTLDRAQEIVEKFHKDMYGLSIRKLSNDVDSLISRVNRMRKSKSKKNTINEDYIYEMQKAATTFESAKKEGDLMGMVEAKASLKAFEKDGRNVYKEEVEKTKWETQALATKVLEELDKNWEQLYTQRFVNTPTSGTPRPSNFVKDVANFFEANFWTHLQFPKIFGQDSVINKVMNIPFIRAIDSFQKKKLEILDNWIPEASKALKGISWDRESQMNKWMLWRNRNSNAHEYNLKNDMVFVKGKDWIYQFKAVANIPEYLRKNKSSVSKWDIVHFWNADEDLKHKILSQVYSEFDSHYVNSKAFKTIEDKFRSHFETNGQSLVKKMKELFNKPLEVIDNYNPLSFYWKWTDSDIIGNVGEMQNFYKDTLEDWFLNTRKGPWKDVRLITDPYELMSRHLNWAVYWGEVVEPLRKAEALYRILHNWRTAVTSDSIDNQVEAMARNKDWNIDPYNLDLWSWEAIHWADGNNAILSPEVDKFLHTHLGKIATQWANLGQKVDFGWNAIVSKVYSHAYRALLSGWRTPFKQLSSLGDMLVQGGEKNFASSMRSTASIDNIQFAVWQSGYLKERQAPVFSKEGYGKNFRTTSHYASSTKVRLKYERGMDAVFGNAIKLMDGATSTTAWMSGMSKYLDENYPSLHKSWAKMDLRKIAKELWEDEWRDAVANADAFMSKIMGSNQIADAGVGTRNTLSKWVLFLWKTWLNRMVTIGDSVQKIFSSKYGVGDRAITAANLVLSTAYTYALFKTIDYFYNQTQVALGVKEEEDIGKITDAMGNVIEDPTFWDKLTHEMLYLVWTVVQSPTGGIDLTKGISPLIQWVKKIENAPTMERKLEEGGFAILNTLIHKDNINLGRKGLSLVGIWKTNVENKKYDAAATKVIDQYKNNWSSPPKNLDELVAIQEKIDKTNKDNAKIEKPIKKIQDTFVKSTLSKYGKDITKTQFLQAAKDNPEFLKTIEPKELQSYYTKIQSTWAKTTWEKDSILMGKPVEVIFDVEVAPLMDIGKAWDAFERVKEMRAKWIIKSDKWAMEMVDLMRKYQSWNKAQ